MDNTQAYYITDWDKHYEVNSNGGAWSPGEHKRKGALPFVRFHVYGPKGDNSAFGEVAEIAEKYGEYAWPVAWGLFCKLLEITARQKSDLRGFLLGRGNNPLSEFSPKIPRTFTKLTGFTEEQIRLGLKVLSDPEIRWIEMRDLPEEIIVSEFSPIAPPLQETKPCIKPNQIKTELPCQQADDAVPEKPIEPLPETTLRKPEKYTCGFILFWNAWPEHTRKSAPGKAFELWKKKKLESQAEHIVIIVTLCKQSRDWKKESGDYIPGPYQWLKDGKYDIEEDQLRLAIENEQKNTATRPGQISPAYHDDNWKQGIDVSKL